MTPSEEQCQAQHRDPLLAAKTRQNPFALSDSKAAHTYMILPDEQAPATTGKANDGMPNHATNIEYWGK